MKSPKVIKVGDIFEIEWDMSVEQWAERTILVAQSQFHLQGTFQRFLEDHPDEPYLLGEWLLSGGYAKEFEPPIYVLVQQEDGRQFVTHHSP